MRADITITNIPTIMGIMVVMAMVIIRPLGLATVTVEAIMAVIRLIGDILEVVIVVAIEAVTAEATMAVIRLIGGILEVGMVAFEAVMAEAIMAAILEVFAEAIDKNGNIF